METLWFILIGWMLATYIVLDGFDIGAGILHLLVAKTDAEREQVIESVGPVWDGNEVWLIAAGGTMFFAFPTLLATSFSGFYLPLMIVLWLLVFRALGIEMRHQLRDPLWRTAWDAALFGSSALLAVFFGAALGNVVRGVPLGADGTFFEPLWTNFRVTGATGILDWYTMLVGLTGVAALVHHGGLWLTARTDGAVAQRSTVWVKRVWPFLAVLLILVTAATFWIQPNARESVANRPWGLIFPATAAVGLVVARYFTAAGRPWPAFLASSALLYGLMASAALAVYPYVLPATDAGFGLTVQDAAAAPHGLRTALTWWIPGMTIACGYFFYTYRSMLKTHTPATSVDR